MYIAMNRFKIKSDHEQDFIEIWKNRESHLDQFQGFQQFHLLQGSSNDEFTLFASHAIWDSAEDFENWTKSDAFRKAHANAGSSKIIYLGPSNFEGFEIVI